MKICPGETESSQNALTVNIQKISSHNNNRQLEKEDKLLKH